MVIATKTMTEEEWKQLTEMRDYIQKSGSVASFDTAYMEHYSYLLSKSLEGKGNEIHPNYY
jgi:aspartate/tyrosine/aromatic aminotransferase